MAVVSLKRTLFASALIGCVVGGPLVAVGLGAVGDVSAVGRIGAERNCLNLRL